MKKLCALFAVVGLTFAANAWAGDFVIETKQLKWKEVGAIVYTDTTFLTDEADTIRTSWIDTSDWDWSAALGNVATGAAIATVRFYVDDVVSVVPTASDTIYFSIEKGSPADTSWGQSTGLVAGIGTQALSGGLAGRRVYEGAIMVDPDTPGVNNVWLTPLFRLRVAGDQSGSSPVQPALKVEISYPKRAASR